MAVDLKYGHLDIPGIGDDEPVFVVRGRDTLAPGTIWNWRRLAEEAGVDQETLDGAAAAATAFTDYQNANGSQLPGNRAEQQTEPEAETTTEETAEPVAEETSEPAAEEQQETTTETTAVEEPQAEASEPEPVADYGSGV